MWLFEIFNSVTNFHWVSGLSPVALIFLPIANLLLYGWIGSTTGYFTCNNKAPSNISSSNRCLVYVTGFNEVHLLTVLGVTSPLLLKLLETSLHVDLASHNNSLDIKTTFTWICTFNCMHTFIKLFFSPRFMFRFYETIHTWPFNIKFFALIKWPWWKIDFFLINVYP